MSFYYRRKLRKIGKALLEGSEKVHLYRGDVLARADLNEQLELAEKVRAEARAYPASVTANLCRWGQFSWRIEHSPLQERP